MSNENSEASISTLEDLKNLCATYARMELAVEDLKSDLKTAQEQFNRFKMDVVPLAFEELGLQELKLLSGETIQITAGVDASISDENRPAAYRWMTENDFGGLIKTELDIAFDREQFSEAQELYQRLIDEYPQAFLAEKIHPQTLKAFVKEQLEVGNELPDSINVHSYSVAKIVRK